MANLSNLSNVANGVKAVGFMFSLKKWCYNLSHFNRYGLMHDDILNEYNPDVAEAVRRLPDHIVDERNFRLIRAAQLSMTKVYLPRDQWTKYEEDIRYLKPYLEEVIKERKEREEWNAK